MSQADDDTYHQFLDPWKEFEESKAEPSPEAHEAQAIAQHIIASECLAHTHRLLAVLKLVRLRVVTLDQVIALAEGHLEEAPEESDATDPDY